MPRYPEWFKKVGDTAAHPKALDVGKKLLGYLAIRRETPGVQTLVQRVTLDDGTTVEASFAGDQPQVIVYSPDGKDACEIYVESGLLDLGPNIAGDADKRFNRGPPEFGDTPATLYFGDGVDCKQGEAGLNGKVRVNPSAKTLASECLPTQGKSVQSRLRDPKKKQAQAMLPASCWSGLMQRYVQAVYGGDTLKYSASGDTLIVEGVPVGGIGNSVGLFDVGGELLFVYCGSSSITAAPVRFKNSCGEAVYRAWRKSVKEPKRQRDKLLTVALSCAFPDARGQRTLLDGFYYEYVSTYGWAFSSARNEAHAVAIDSDRATLVKLDISFFNGEFRANITEVEQADLPPRYVSCGVSSHGVVPRPIHRQSEPSLRKFDVPLESDSYDHPLTCYYEDDSLVVVRYSFMAQGQLDGVMVGDECYDYRQGRPAGDYATTTDTIESVRIVGDVIFGIGCKYAQIPFAAKVSSGIYARGANGVRWSTQRTSSAFRILRTEDKYGVADGSVYVSPFGTLIYDSTYGEVAEPKTYTGTGVIDKGVGSHWRELVGNVCGLDVYNYHAACSGCEVGNCKETALYSAPEFGFEWVMDGDCAVIQSTGGFHSAVEVDSSYSCTSPCFFTHNKFISGTIAIGQLNELAIPDGDCSAFVAVSEFRKGVISGSGYNYIANIPTRACKGIAGSECSGSITLSCDGLPDTEHAHAPHTQTYTYSVGEYKPYTGLPRANEGFFDDSCARFHNTARNIIRLDAQCTTVCAEGQSHTLARGELLEVSHNTKTSDCDDVDQPTVDDVVNFTSDTPKFPFIYEAINTKKTKGKTEVLSADGVTSIEKYLTNTECAGVLQDGWNYMFRKSLLGAGTAWQDALTFGASILMDRETITGGYPNVSTPSFVGWA